MKAAWDILPKWLKTVLIVLFVLFYTPWWVREQVISFVDSRVHATIMPLKEKRDAELSTMKEDIHDIKIDTREIRNHLLGTK